MGFAALAAEFVTRPETWPVFAEYAAEQLGGPLTLEAGQRFAAMLLDGAQVALRSERTAR
jgi:hypothetical protein